MSNEIIKLPGYPFDARDLYGDLRDLLAKHYEDPMGFDRLAQLLGKSKSTAHFWFDVHRSHNLLGFMALLERLPAQRNGQLELWAHVTRQGTVIIQGPLIRGKYVVLELHLDGHAETIFFGLSKP